MYMLIVYPNSPVLLFPGLLKGIRAVDLGSKASQIRVAQSDANKTAGKTTGLRLACNRFAAMTLVIR